MPLHIGKGRTVSRAISDIIDYVENPKKTDNGRLITGYECDSRTADAEFLLAKREYIAKTGRVRGADDVIAYQLRQSFARVRLPRRKRTGSAVNWRSDLRRAITLLLSVPI